MWMIDIFSYHIDIVEYDGYSDMLVDFREMKGRGASHGTLLWVMVF